MIYKNIQTKVSLANFTTWRIGGPAEWFCEPKTINEITQLIDWANSKDIPITTIGAGSNLLINDTGIRGLTLCMKKFQGININNGTGVIEALGGEPIPTLARRAAKNGLHGLEWAIGIPGTVGGGVIMNAGAQGSCFADRIESVKVIPLRGGVPFEIKRKDLKFGYRQSILQSKELLVISARLILEPGHDHNRIIQITNQNLNSRLKSQPYHLPSCGSVFRNPEPLKAGQIIESLGLKGLRVGGAEVSTIHANFIINESNATANDICELISLIQKKVKNAHDFLLQPEVKQLGF